MGGRPLIFFGTTLKTSGSINHGGSGNITQFGGGGGSSLKKGLAESFPGWAPKKRLCGAPLYKEGGQKGCFFPLGGETSILVGRGGEDTHTYSLYRRALAPTSLGS